MAKMLIFIRERPHLQGVPSSKTVHRTVFEFTLCGALEGNLRGFAPYSLT